MLEKRAASTLILVPTKKNHGDELDTLWGLLSTWKGTVESESEVGFDVGPAKSSKLMNFVRMIAGLVRFGRYIHRLKAGGVRGGLAQVPGRSEGSWHQKLRVKSNKKVKILKNGVEVGEGVVHLWLGGRGSEAWKKVEKRPVESESVVGFGVGPPKRM